MMAKRTSKDRRKRGKEETVEWGTDDDCRQTKVVGVITGGQTFDIVKKKKGSLLTSSSRLLYPAWLPHARFGHRLEPLLILLGLLLSRHRRRR